MAGKTGVKSLISCCGPSTPRSPQLPSRPGCGLGQGTMRVFHTPWRPCLSELPLGEGARSCQPCLWPHFSWWLRGRDSLGSTRHGFQSQHSPSRCVALELSLFSEPLYPGGGGRLKMTISNHPAPTELSTVPARWPGPRMREVSAPRCPCPGAAPLLASLFPLIAMEPNLLAPGSR